MKTCATCEHYNPDERWCVSLCTYIGRQDKQSCIEHKEKVEKKKVLIRWALMVSEEGYWLTNGTSANEDGRFIRWLTPEDMRKIMEGKEIEVEQ